MLVVCHADAFLSQSTAVNNTAPYAEKKNGAALAKNAVAEGTDITAFRDYLVTSLVEFHPYKLGEGLELHNEATAAEEYAAQLGHITVRMGLPR